MDFAIGKKLRIKRFFAGDDKTSIENASWVNAVIDYIPSHKEFVVCRMVFRDMFGVQTSYRESFRVWDLEQMFKNGMAKEVT